MAERNAASCRGYWVTTFKHPYGAGRRICKKVNHTRRAGGRRGGERGRGEMGRRGAEYSGAEYSGAGYSVLSIVRRDAI